MVKLHQNEIPIDADLVRNLVDNQFPEFAALPVSPLGASGSTNLLFRLGDELLIRLPRQPGNGAAITKEQRWLPKIRQALPVAVPEIVGVGDPAFGYTEKWAITGWLEGVHPAVAQPDLPASSEPRALAVDLADLILAFRELEITDTAASDPDLRGYRGRALLDYDRAFNRTIEKCRLINELDLDLDAALTIWSQSLKLPGASAPAADCWFHSDLVAENMLLRGDRLSGVLDFGGLSVGDPTIDLHGAWELFDPVARERFRTRLGVDDAQWLRGRAWALAIALGALSYYWETMPGRSHDRLVMARAVLAHATDSQ